MSDVPLPDLLNKLQQWGKERRRNEVARILAALDLLSEEQIHTWMMKVGIRAAYTTNRKQLLETIRQELVK